MSMPESNIEDDFLIYNKLYNREFLSTYSHKLMDEFIFKFCFKMFIENILELKINRLKFKLPLNSKTEWCE